jgi:Ca-activated chloride channel homolog
MSETPKKKNSLPTILVAIALCGLAGVALVRSFSTTVKHKFEAANSEVQKEVKFGGPNDSYAEVEKEVKFKGGNDSYPSNQAAPAAEYESPPEPEPVAAKVMQPSTGIVVETGVPEPPRPTEQKPSEVKVNEATSTEVDRFSTFAVDVDTGSYTSARSALQSGYSPDVHAVRVEEFVNYFNYSYPAPAKEPFSVSMEGAPSPFSAEPNTYIMRVGVQGRQIAQKDRKPTHLTFLVDVSGSMSSVDKLPLAVAALKILTNNMRPQDSVALVTYAGYTSVALEDTAATPAGKKKIIKALDELMSGGGTAMSSGMELAYKEAAKNAKPGHISRVIVLSDGDANIGPVSQSEIQSTIAGHVKDGITMTTIGLGGGNYNDAMMEQLANKGNGNYYYIDSKREAERIFGEKIGGTLEVIAKDVKIQVEFNPAMVKSYRLIGYENRDIADNDFRNDKVDAGEIGSGHTVTALYELTCAPTMSEDLAYVRLRHKQPEGDRASEQSFTLRPADMRAKLSDASADLQFASAVAMLAEKLRGSKYATKISFDLIREIATASSSANQEDRQELIELIGKAQSLTDKGWQKQ